MLKSDYLSNLNEKQQEAVVSLDGPLLIVAGAGSGKTKVLTSRIAHIIKSHKAFSNQILAHHVPVDLREAQLPVDKLITTSMNHVSIKLWRKPNYWQIFLPRSYSESLWRLLSETAEQYGFKQK